MALRVIIMVFHEYMDFALHNSGFSLSISGAGFLLAKASSTGCWCSNIHLVNWRCDRRCYFQNVLLFCDLHLLSLDKWPICRMFEINLLARHAPSGEAFVVALHSLPSIKKLLEGIQCVVEEEYLAFPSIPCPRRSASGWEQWDGFFYLPLMLRAVLIVSIDKSMSAADNWQWCRLSWTNPTQIGMGYTLGMVWWGDDD